MKQIDGGMHEAGLAILRFGAMAAIAVCARSASAQVEQVQSVVDMAGTRMTAGATVGISAAGQFVAGVNQGSGGMILNYAGFLTAMILQRELDTDGDGTCDEMDNDNDNDGLDDIVEILGTAFVPDTPTDQNNADTDGDNMRDSDEAVAGTDPTNAVSLLEMTQIRFEDGGIWVSWMGGTSARQILLRRASLISLEEEWAAISTNEPPTFAAMTFFDANATNNMYFYRIKVERPYGP